MPGERIPLCALLLLLGAAAAGAEGGRILVWYTEGSHWINMKPVLESLVDRGHHVTVLIPSTSIFMKASEESRFDYLQFNISISLEELESFMEEFLAFSIYEIDYMNYFQLYAKFITMMTKDMQYAFKYLDGVVKSENIMSKLKEGNYDLVLADPIYLGSELVAEILDVPLIYSLRFSMVYNFERYCGQMPSPPSFVPAIMSKLTDKMSFSERVWNFLFYALNDAVIEFTLWSEVDKYYTEFKGKRRAAATQIQPK